MKLSTVRKLERAAMAMFKAATADGSRDAQALVADYDKNMMAWGRQRRTMECAAAERKDKGVVLFTVFRPGKNCMNESVRTPNRMGTAYHWRRGHPVTTHFERGELNWVTENFYTPEQSFRQLMRVEVAA